VRPIGSGELTATESCFVEPTWYEPAREVIGAENVAVLVAEPGSGKRTTALRLLIHCAEQPRDDGVDELAITELVPDWEDPNADRLPAEPNHGYLLDLGRDRRRPMCQFAKGLRTLRASLRSRNSYLVVTATADQWEFCRGVFEQVVVSTGEPPPAIEIAQKRVAFLAPARLSWLEHQTLRGLPTSDARPGDGVRLAQAIAYATEDGERGVYRALAEFQRWRDHVRQWFDGHPDLEDRALMTAAAVLDGDPAEDVFVAADLLLDRVAAQVRAPSSPLAGRGRTARLAELDTEPVSRPDSTVHLSRARPGVDEAVLDHVLMEYPRLRSSLLAWIVGLAAAPSATEQGVAGFARVLIGIAARRGVPALDDWLTEHAVEHRQLATAMLDQALRHPELGGRARCWVRRWAAAEPVDEAHAQLVADVSAGALGGHFPTLALAMLLQIQPAYDSAADALVRLAGHDRHRRQVLETVVEWLGRTDRRRAGGHCFLALMQPGPDSVLVRLLAEAGTAPAVHELLRTGWRGLVTSDVPARQVTTLIEAWVAALEREELPRHPAAGLLMVALVDVVRTRAGLAADAAAGQGELAARLDLVRRVLDLLA
jgi:hypothetical protein